MLKKLVDEKGGEVVSIGKIADIYAQVGITQKVKATGLDALFDATIEEMKKRAITPSFSLTLLILTRLTATAVMLLVMPPR